MNDISRDDNGQFTTWDPVNKITMKNMASLNWRIIASKQRIKASIPAKYHPLLDMYETLTETGVELDKHLDDNRAFDYVTWHEAKELTQDANELAATIKPVIPNELKDTVMDVWNMVKPNRDNEPEASK